MPIFASILRCRLRCGRSFTSSMMSSGTGRGHSILITSDSTICQDAVEVHGVAPQGIGDVVDLVEAQDVEGETAQDGEDGRALADAAGVFMHGDVQYVMNAVLHAPVAAGRDGIIGGAAVVLG